MGQRNSLASKLIWTFERQNSHCHHTLNHFVMHFDATLLLQEKAQATNIPKIGQITKIYFQPLYQYDIRISVSLFADETQ